MKKNLLHFLSLFLVIVFIISCVDSIKDNSDDEKSSYLLSEEAKEYLSNNSVYLDIFDNGDFSTFSILDPYLEDNDIFFIGEQHLTKKNYDINLKFLKYFNQKEGIRYYLTEAGYGDTCIWNRYLETGEEEYRRKLMNLLKGATGYLVETYEFWRKVREYNLTISADRRVVFIGVDVQHQPDTGIFALYLLLPVSSGNEPPHINEIRNLYAELNGNDFRREDYRNDMLGDIRTLIMNISEELETDESLYREYLGETLFDFKLIIKGCLDGYSFYDSEHDWRIREEAMYSNFLLIYDNLPDSIPKRFYGQWGGFHVYQISAENNPQGTKCFATMLEHGEDSPVKEKIISMHTFYHNSSYYDKESGGAKNITFETNFSSELYKLALGDVTLFNLIGENSPFKRESLLIHPSYEVGNYPTTDYFQFAILVTNSPAATPWE